MKNHDAVFVEMRTAISAMGKWDLWIFRNCTVVELWKRMEQVSELDGEIGILSAWRLSSNTMLSLFPCQATDSHNGGGRASWVLLCSQALQPLPQTDELQARILHPNPS